MIPAKSLWHIDHAHSAILDQPLPQLSNQIPLKSLYSLISLGTERIVAKGQVPQSMFEKMKVPYMEGNFDFPVKYGYSLIAESLEGKVYHLMHPHQDHVAADSSSLTEIPETLSPPRACLISNMETALNAYWDSEAGMEEAILIVGFGLIGYLIAGVLKLNGCHNIAVHESNISRIKLAKKLGFKLLHEEQGSAQFDLAFHCSASAEGLQTCIDKMGFEGRIMDLSWYGNGVVPLRLGETFHYNRLTIKSSQVSHIPVKMQAIWDFAKRKLKVIQLLSDPYWDAYDIPIIPFKESPALFEKIRQSKTDELTYILKY